MKYRESINHPGAGDKWRAIHALRYSSSMNRISPGGRPTMTCHVQVVMFFEHVSTMTCHVQKGALCMLELILN